MRKAVIGFAVVLLIVGGIGIAISGIGGKKTGQDNSPPKVTEYSIGETAVADGICSFSITDIKLADKLTAINAEGKESGIESKDENTLLIVTMEYTNLSGKPLTLIKANSLSWRKTDAWQNTDVWSIFPLLQATYEYGKDTNKISEFAIFSNMDGMNTVELLEFQPGETKRSYYVVNIPIGCRFLVPTFDFSNAVYGALSADKPKAAEIGKWTFSNVPTVE